MRWYTYTELRVGFERVTLMRGRYTVCGIISLKYVNNTEHHSKIHQEHSTHINSAFCTHVVNQKMPTRNMYLINN